MLTARFFYFSNLEPRTSNLEPRTSNLEPRTPRLYSAQDFLLCVACTASVHSVVQKIKTLFTTEVTESTEEEIKDKGFRQRLSQAQCLG